MKKQLISLFIMLLLLSLFNHCVIAESSEEEQIISQYYLDLYAPVFDTYQFFLQNGRESNNVNQTERGDYYFILGSTGISYLTRYTNDLGYCLIDLNSDSVPELIISSHDENSSYPNYIYDLFALNSGIPKRVVAGTNKFRYQLCSDNTILFDVPRGAMNHIVVKYALNECSLTCIEGILMLNDEPRTAGFYKFVGDRYEQDPWFSEEDIILSEEEYYQIWENYKASVVTLDLTPIIP